MDKTGLREDLRGARTGLLLTAAEVDDATLRVRPGDGEWSVIEVLAHLVDVDRHWLGQALAIRDDPAHTFMPFDDERWKREHTGARATSRADVLAALAASHGAVLEALDLMPPETLQRAGRHARHGAYTVADVFRRYPAHDHDHALQITDIMSRLGRRPES